ncbi:MAG TPA: arsenate reductase (glutaredoxin) [Nitrospinaceae bacterium]|nr:arsenate reductase (glutaredoxin) [Nitrospinaceae bacterium]
MNVSIFHNPKCSKSRATLKLLNEKGIAPEVILYLEMPPTEAALSEILDKLGLEAKKLIRFKERIVPELGISPDDRRTDSEWIWLMVENPILIERPIVITPEKAAIGRPPENILKIINR